MSIFRRRLLLMVGMVLVAAPVYAQEVALRGFVKDADDGQPMAGVNVSLTRDDESLRGATTNADGFFAISGLEPGQYAVRASFVGYALFRDTLSLEAGELTTLDIELRPTETQLDELTVEEEQETTGAASVSAGLQTVRTEDIETIPTPDVSGDLASYLVTMPGVVSPGDRGGQLFVRGGEPSQNLVVLDGITLYQPFHLIGFYSAFPSNIINTSDVYAGGFGAQYGGRLSSVIDVTSRNGNKHRFSGSVSAAPFMSGIHLEGPIIKNRVSVLGSWRQSVIEEGAARLVDQELPFNFSDQFGKVHADLSTNAQLSVTGLRTYDRGVISPEGEAPDDIAAPSIADQTVVWRNRAAGGRFLWLPSELPAMAEIVLSGSEVTNRFGPADDPARSSSARQFKAMANVTQYVDNFDINWGLYLRTSNLESNMGGQFQTADLESEYVTEAGAYLAPQVRVLGSLQLHPGVRVQSFPSKGRLFVEPRLRAVWHLGMHRLSGAWGLYHQEIVGLNDKRDAGNVFTAWASSPFGEVPSAMHAIAGYQFEPSSQLSFSIESFYKNLSNLYVSEWTALPRFNTSLQRADGRVFGFDLRAELTLNPFYGFISYGYANVKYEAQQSTLQFWYGTPSKQYTPPHDRRHQLNAVGNLDLYGFTLSARWQFGSGLPYSQAAGFDEFLFLNGPTDVTERPGQTRVLYGERYASRLPTYHRLDLSLKRAQQLYDRLRGTVQISLTNAYNRRNLFYLDLFTLRRANQLPLIPSLGIKLEMQ